MISLISAGCNSPSVSKPKVASLRTVSQSCHASWYGPGFHGRKMANGKRYNMHDRSTVAHKKLPFGTVVRITNKRNGKSIIGRIKDRGPYIKGRCVDLSKAGAHVLGLIATGTAPVRLEVMRR